MNDNERARCRKWQDIYTDIATMYHYADGAPVAEGGPTVRELCGMPWPTWLPTIEREVRDAVHRMPEYQRPGREALIREAESIGSV